MALYMWFVKDTESLYMLDVFSGNIFYWEGKIYMA